ncbi:MAG: HEAT repeat domain-containing protein [Candidatus Heimdallarchaeota archaeon]|nr:HEAT repeat domain-containing protein [Candidatus Heimdallarchaeota archaeon]
MDESRRIIIQDMLNQLNSDDWVIRCNAAKILGNIDAEEAIEEILEKLKRENNRDVRKKIVQAIGEIDLKVAVPLLVTVMKNDGSMMVRYTAARALGRMGAKEAIPDIKERVAKETNFDSIFWFHIALTRLEDDDKGQGIQTIKNMKKKGLLGEKQDKIFSNLLNELAKKKKKIKKQKKVNNQ